MKVKHGEIEIDYDESDNRWHFELRGRQRSAESLAKAKEYIDKPVVEKEEKEEKAFKRIKAYVPRNHYGRDDLVEGEVTSVAEKDHGYQKVWTMIDKKREKRNASDCFDFTPENAALLAEANRLEAQIEKLYEEKANALSKLTAIKVWQ